MNETVRAPDPFDPPPQRIRRSQLVLVLSAVLRIALALGTTTVLGRALGEAEFGFYTLVGTLFFLVHILLDLGTGGTAVRAVAQEPGRERPLLEGLVAARALSGTGLGMALAVLALFEADPLRRGVLLAAAIVFPLIGAGALSVAFQVRQQPDGPAALGLVAHAAVLGLTIAGTRLGLPGPAFATFIVLRELATALGLVVLSRRQLGLHLRPGFAGRGTGTFLAAGLVQGTAVVLQAAYFHVDVFLVRRLLGEAALGAYGAAYRPFSPLLMLPGMIMGPLLPALAADDLRGRAAFVARLRGPVAFFAGVAVLALAGGLALAGDFLRVFYGGRYLAEPHDASAAFRWMSVAFAVVVATAPLGTALLAARGERALVAIGAIALAANLGGNLLLLPRLGFTAAALMTAVTEALVGVGTVIALARRRGLDFVDRRTPAGLLAAAPFAAAFAWLPGPPLVRTVLGAGLGVAGVLLVARVTRAQRPAEGRS